MKKIESRGEKKRASRYLTRTLTRRKKVMARARASVPLLLSSSLPFFLSFAYSSPSLLHDITSEREWLLIHEEYAQFHNYRVSRANNRRARYEVSYADDNHLDKTDGRRAKLLIETASGAVQVARKSISARGSLTRKRLDNRSIVLISSFSHINIEYPWPL